MIRSLCFGVALSILHPGFSGGVSPAAAYSELQTIVFVHGRLSQSSQSVEVPVDRSVTSLEVSLLFPPGTAPTLVRPGGAAVKASDRDVRVQGVDAVPIRNTIQADGRHLTITSPAPGLWRVDLAASAASGQSMFAILVQGQSPAEFQHFKFVHKEVMNIHGPYFSIDGLPLAGRPEFGQAIVSTGLETAVFRAVDVTGATLSTLPLRTGEAHLPPQWLVGAFELPSVPFYVVLDAVDSSGTPIRRQFPELFRAQPVSVSFDLDGLITRPDFYRTGPLNAGEYMALARFDRVIAAGASRTLRFVVTNLGASTARFSIEVTTDVGVARVVSPRVLSLAPGATGDAIILVTIPASATTGQSISLQVKASDTAKDSVGNFTELELEVARKD